MEILLENVQPDCLPAEADHPFWGRIIRMTPECRVVLSGASGRGKTTALRLLYGTSLAYTGRIVVNGCDWRTVTAPELAVFRRERLSIVFQDLELFDELSVWDNLRLRLAVAPLLSLGEIEEVARRLSIAGLLDKSVSTLSRGERQRVAILRALLSPFSWLFLDEPFAHLDPAAAKAALELIDETCRRRTAGCLITCHDDAPLFEGETRYRL